MGYCECGYNITVPIGPQSSLATFSFTDLLEADFLHLVDVSKDTDWARQSYAMTPDVARGPYGLVLSPSSYSRVQYSEYQLTYF